MPPTEYNILKGGNFMNKNKEISDLEYNVLQETKNIALKIIIHDSLF